ncbi:MAG TPA: hypothetical protein VIN10_04580, partial [Bacteroidales bacterium]
LLNPFYKTKIRKIEKPIVIVGLDNSMSIISEKDSVYFRSEFPLQIQQLISTLSDDYQVDTYLFGSEVRPGNSFNFADETSDYAAFINQIKVDYKSLNVGSLVIAGDGISNRGIDPEFAASNINFPVYTIALGDTNQNKDFKINDLTYNSIAYSGDLLPFRINISALQLAGNKATILVTAFGKQQFNKEILINDDLYNQSFDFKIKAESNGKQRVTFIIQSDAEEITKENNRRDIFIDILDTRKKILILANSPHPDLGAIKLSLEQSHNYSIDIQYPEKRSGNLLEYDLIIFHQLPSARQFIGPLITEITKNQIPQLFILGQQSNILQFNQYFRGLNIRSGTRNFEDAQADFNSVFSLFSFDKEAIEALEKFPPLLVPVGNYQLSPGAEIFAYQRIRNFKTDFPLVVFYSEDESKKGVIAGEGLWLWRMHNYLQDDNYQAFDEFFNKTVQYLVARKDKRFFKVISKGEYSSSERIILRAELFDQSYKPVNNVEVDFKLTNESGEQFNHVFSTDGNSYMLDLKILPEGIYHYSSSSKVGAENYKASGEFVVKRSSLESRDLRANHSMLFRLSDQHDGQMFYPQQIAELSDLLLQKDLKGKIYFEEKFTNLKDLPLVLFLILLLLSAEWFFRKYFGSY